MALERICAEVEEIDVVVGHPLRENGQLYNACSLIRAGEIVATYRKQHLPNYSVFDEKRYFQGSENRNSLTGSRRSVNEGAEQW